MSDEQSEISILRRRVLRERRARLEAETLLEEKSREVFTAYQKLSGLAERARQQADQLRAVVDHVGEGIITYDDEGRIKSFNFAAEKIFGCTPIEASLIRIGDLIPSLIDPAHESQKDLEIDSAFPFEERGIKFDKTEFPIEFVVNTYSYEGKRLHTALIRDRTSRRQLEQKLSTSQKMESVGLLASGIAHEINTPMQFVGDNTRFLSEVFSEFEDLLTLCIRLANEPESDRGQNDELSQIKEAVQRMDLALLKKDVPAAAQQTLEGVERVTDIIRALKEFSHPGEQQKVAVDLNRAIQNSVALSRSQWKYLAEVELDLEADLPLVQCYPSEFQQVIVNLLINAAQAIEEKKQEKRGSIRISTRLDKSTVKIAVSDSGVGMSEKIKRRIFDPFFTTKPVGHGTGQGLAICYAVVVDKLHGQLECHSDLGIGTTFTISIPFEPAVTPTAKVAVELVDSVDEFHVLFVDDDQNILDGLRRMLRTVPSNWRLHFAASGSAALALAKKQPIDVVFSDMRMPVMDGAEFLSQMKVEHPRTVRGILSGQADVEQTIQLVGSAHFYLAKPCSPKAIKAAIQNLSNVIGRLPDQKTREKIFSIEAVPSDPRILQQVQTELANGRGADLARLLASDLGLSARLTQLSCGSFLGRAQSGNRIDQMAANLDREVLNRLASSRAFSRPMPSGLEWFPIQSLLADCQRLGTLAEKIAEAETADRAVVSASFNAGWLSGLGRLVLASIYPEQYLAACLSIGEEFPSLIAIEEDRFGCNHLEVGALLLGTWGAPQPIVDALLNSLEICQYSEVFSPTQALQAAIVIASEHPGEHTDLGVVFDSKLIGVLAMDLETQLTRWRSL